MGGGGKCSAVWEGGAGATLPRRGRSFDLPAAPMAMVGIDPAALRHDGALGHAPAPHAAPDPADRSSQGARLGAAPCRAPSTVHSAWSPHLSLIPGPLFCVDKCGLECLLDAGLQGFSRLAMLLLGPGPRPGGVDRRESPEPHHVMGAGPLPRSHDPHIKMHIGDRAVWASRWQGLRCQGAPRCDGQRPLSCGAGTPQGGRGCAGHGQLGIT